MLWFYLVPLLLGAAVGVAVRFLQPAPQQGTADHRVRNAIVAGVITMVVVGIAVGFATNWFGLAAARPASTVAQQPVASAEYVVEKDAEKIVEKPAEKVIEKPVEKAVAQQANFTRAQVDAVLGQGNWVCFPDRIDGVAVRNWPLGQKVIWPLSAVDKGVKYGSNELVPGTGAATAWLAGALASREECPLSGSVVESTKAPAKLVNPAVVDCTISRFGTITRFPDRFDAVKLDATSTFVVPNSWSMDKEGVKYLAGQSVPSGIMTAWGPQECKGQIK